MTLTAMPGAPHVTRLPRSRRLAKWVALLAPCILASGVGFGLARARGVESSWPADPVEAAAIRGLLAEQSEAQARWKTTFEAIRGQARARLRAPVEFDTNRGLWFVPEAPATVTSER